MGKSLKQIQQAKAKNKTSALPTRTVEICLRQDLVAKVEKLDGDKADLLDERQRLTGSSDPDAAVSPSKLNSGVNPRVAEIDAEVAEIDASLAGLSEEMNDYTGVLTLRGEGWGKWRRWADDNPARVYDPADKNVDQRIVAAARLDREVTFGYCDASALFARLGDFAESWDDAPIEEGQWELIEEDAAGGDLKEAARNVVQMHEMNGLRAPKSPRPSKATSSPSTA